MADQMCFEAKMGGAITINLLKEKLESNDVPEFVEELYKWNDETRMYSSREYASPDELRSKLLLFIQGSSETLEFDNRFASYDFIEQFITLCQKYRVEGTVSYASDQDGNATLVRIKDGSPMHVNTDSSGEILVPLNEIKDFPKRKILATYNGLDELPPFTYEEK